MIPPGVPPEARGSLTRLHSPLQQVYSRGKERLRPSGVRRRAFSLKNVASSPSILRYQATAPTRRGRRTTMRHGTDGRLFLRRGEDIERAKRTGRRVPAACFNMVIARADSQHTKIAVIVGRKFGPATMRNLAKRRVRELARSVEDRLAPHYHVLIFPKTALVKMVYSQLGQVWERAFLSEGLLNG